MGGQVPTPKGSKGGEHALSGKTWALLAVVSLVCGLVGGVGGALAVNALTDDEDGTGSSQQMQNVANNILSAWRSYTDESVGILAETDGTPHNTVTPILHYDETEGYILDLALRNNRTSEEYPDGIFHPHREYHNIKKENIGLIEVMGLAVLPSRLKDEMAILKDAILNHKDVSEIPKISKHSEWVNEFVSQYDEINENNPSSIGQYVDPSIQEKWTYWLAAAESKYEDFVLMPKEPNSQILSEIELTEGWSEVALTTRYKAMLAVAQKLFF